MSVRTILVSLGAAPEDRRCLKGAQALAAKAHAHIDALYVIPDPREELAQLSPREANIPSIIVDQCEAASTQRRDSVESDFAEWLHEAGVSATAEDGARLHFETGDQGDAMRSHALLADMVVAPLPGQTNPRRFDAIVRALIDAGKPVLGLPMLAPIPVFAPNQVAAVAWNGSAEASRAVTAALPLLRDCSEVVLLSVGQDRSAQDLAPVLAYLRRHGIRATPRIVDEKGDTGTLIHREAHAVGARYLVMGAFSRGAVRELVFGGVTDFMLRNASLPLLLAH